MKPIQVTLLADPVLDSLDRADTGRGDGQPATWLPQFAKSAIAQDEIRFHWISLNRQTRSLREERFGSHCFVELPQIPASLDIRTGFWFARRSLLSEIRRFPCDIVHCWGTERPYPSVIGKVSQPTVLSMNGVLCALKSRGVLHESAFWENLARLEMRALPLADAITTESEWASNEIRNFTQVRPSTVAYGVNPSFYDVTWQPSPDKPSLLCAGTVCKGKGSDILVAAFQKLGRSDITLHMVGDGPMRTELESLHVPGIVWHGQVGWEKMRSLMAESWCLIHPTLADSNPNVVKESRVIGLPIVTTRHGGQTDYLVAGGNTWIVEPFNANTLAQAIDTAMRDFAVVRASGECNHHQDRKRFLSETTLNSFREVYQNMINSAR